MIGFNDGTKVREEWDRSDTETSKLQNVYIVEENRWMVLEEVNHYHTILVKSIKALHKKLGENSHKLITDKINSVVDFIIPDYDFEGPCSGVALESHINPF